MAGIRGVIKWAGVRSRCSERAHPRLIGAGNRHPADVGAARETKSAGYACRDSAEASVDAGSIPAASTKH
jgi:hypothetical protein